VRCGAGIVGGCASAQVADAPGRLLAAAPVSPPARVPEKTDALTTYRTDQRHQFVANIKSQKKRILTNEKARLRNKAVKSSLKTAIRKFHEAADAGDAEKATEAAQAANRQLDKAASKGVIHKNQAANRKSSISKRAASL
jgi:small subunit ribosomal protein S20